MSEAFEAWRREGRTYRHRGHAIFYRDEGTGPVLLAMHGFPSASWDWQPMWRALTARFRVIAADMIGFGWSDKPPRYDYAIMDQATLHEGLLRELGVERVHVLAHDYGVTVAQELLARHDERGRRGERGLELASICFLNGGLFPETHRPRLVQKLLASPLGPLVGRLTTKRAFASGLHAIFGPRTPPSSAFVDELWTLFRHQGGERVVHRIIGYMAERRRHRERWVGVLTRTAVPLRVINGLVDPVSGAHMVARYREMVPQADVVELPDIGHYPQVEDPEGVLRGFMAFHDRLGTARS
ncbi:Hydrolase, alpha/beta fold family protein [Minicystis rosea]|nr:Hydrolase, alpha/beta fold family protein [Minicystis rosea]